MAQQIFIKNMIPANQIHIFLYCLCDDDSIKGIPVVEDKLVLPDCMQESNGKNLDTIFFQHHQ